MSENLALIKQIMDQLQAASKRNDELAAKNEAITAQVLELSKQLSEKKYAPQEKVLSQLSNLSNKQQELSNDVNGSVKYATELILKYAKVNNFT